MNKNYKQRFQSFRQFIFHKNNASIFCLCLTCVGFFCHYLLKPGQACFIRIQNKIQAHKNPAHEIPAHKNPALIKTEITKTPAQNNPAHNDQAHKIPAHKNSAQNDTARMNTADEIQLTINLRAKSQLIKL